MRSRLHLCKWWAVIGPEPDPRFSARFGIPFCSLVSGKEAGRSRDALFANEKTEPQAGAMASL